MVYSGTRKPPGENDLEYLAYFWDHVYKGYRGKLAHD